MKINKNFSELQLPENLKIAMQIRNNFNNNDVYHNFILGQSPFPVFDGLKNSLSKHADKSFYSAFDGIEDLKVAIQKFNSHYLKLYTEKNRIVFGYGTKHIMSLLFQMLDGHFVLPVPAWVGYEPLLKMHNKKYTKLRLTDKDDYKIIPEKLEDFITQLKEPCILILNNPHNPTGALYSEQDLMKLRKVLLEYDVTVISDEIYGLMTFHTNDFVSMAKIYPEKTFMTSGLSKDRSAAGYRFGVCVLPSNQTNELSEIYHKIIANTFTNITTPIQYAAVEGYALTDDLNRYINITRRVHSISADVIYNEANKIPKAKVSKPKGGFYLTIDLNAYKQLFFNHGITTASKLTENLLKEPYFVACVAGETIGLSQDDFTLRIAFIDYDGAKVLKRCTDTKNITQEMLMSYMVRMVEGIKKIGVFLNNLT